MKKIAKLLLPFAFFSANSTFAQKFTIICDAANLNSTVSNPFISIRENTFDDYGTETIIKLIQRGPGFEASLWNKAPVFFQLYNAEILAIPNQKVEGALKSDGSDFILRDSNNVNSLIAEIQNSINGIKLTYNKNTSFKDFLKLYDTLEKYINKTTVYIGTQEVRKRYGLSNEVLSAVRQFCITRLAHFSVYPILLHGEYTEKLFALINSSIVINNPSYWMQLQAGRIFLRTYFLELALPEASYNFEKALAANKMFVNPEIKKYLGYHYFKDILSKEDRTIPIDELITGFNSYKSSYRFTTKELKTLEGLKGNLSMMGKNIIPLFVKQSLTNIAGAELNSNEKEGLLKNRDKVIIDYWASWCLPCIEVISKLKSDEVIYKGQKCKIIFISIDEKNENWLSKKYPVLNTSNSFRLNNFKTSSFNTFFNLQAIPRLFLVEDGFLLNQNFEREKLY